MNIFPKIMKKSNCFKSLGNKIVPRLLNFLGNGDEIAVFEKWKSKLKTASKETIKEELKAHLPEILSVATILMLGYLCIKVNGKPVNITVNVNGGMRYDRF